MEHHPKITFRGDRVELKGENKATLTGELTIRGVTRKAALDVRYLARIIHRRGAEKIG